MLSVTSATRVLVATTPVDLRGSFNRLHSLVVEQLKGDPLSGDLCSPMGDGTGSRCFIGTGLVYGYVRSDWNRGASLGQ
jgi:hypothetical protein